MNFDKRSYQPELLDAANIPFPDIRKNMEELDTINTLLGGHAITLKGFRKLLGLKKSVSVCEIGCGGGDNLKAIVEWCNRHQIQVRCTGIDLKKECIDVARLQKSLSANCEWIVSDYADVVFDEKPDILFSSLFCHHFTEEELINQLPWMQTHSQIGFFINDLHRHPLAYHSIRLLTRIFSSSYLVKHDAPVSVTRGFLKKEWVQLCKAAGLQHITIQWKWAFRHLIVYQHA